MPKEIIFTIIEKLRWRSAKMRKYALLLAIIILFFSNEMSAQTNRAGLGIILVEPTGLSWKYWWGKKEAVHLALGWSSQKDNNLVVHADYLFSQINLFKEEMSTILLSFGSGGRLKFNRDMHFGIRFPLALDFISKKVPLNIFFEIVPIVNLTPDTSIDLKGAIGFRYLYK